MPRYASDLELTPELREKRPIHALSVNYYNPNKMFYLIVWAEPDNVTVEVRTAIKLDSRVLGVGYLKFVLPPLATPHLISPLRDPSTEYLTEMMLNLFQGAIKRSAEGSTCQRCSNIPSRNVSSAYFICRPNDVAVKEGTVLQ